jgi:hypothetical protein
MSTVVFVVVIVIVVVVTTQVKNNSYADNQQTNAAHDSDNVNPNLNTIVSARDCLLSMKES